MRKSPHKSRILVVDDEPFVLRALINELKNNYTVDGYLNPQEALHNINTQNYDLAILDVRMPGIDGLELANHIRIKNPHLPVFFFTGYPDSKAVQWVENHSKAYRVAKPWLKDLFILVKRVIESQTAKHHLNTFLQDIIQLITELEKTPAMETALIKVKKRVEKLDSFDRVEIYREDKPEHYTEISCHKKADGIRKRLLRNLNRSEQPLLLKEKHNWIWATKLSDYYLLVQLTNLEEEQYNYLHILKGLLHLANVPRENGMRMEDLGKMIERTLQGELFRSFSHTANNYLGAIMGHADLLAMNQKIDKKSKQNLEIIQDSANIISTLLTEYKNCFPHPDPPTDVNLTETFDSAYHYLVREFENNNIKVEHNLPPDATISGRRNLVKALFLSALIRGWQEMKEGGKLNISCEPLNSGWKLEFSWKGIEISPEDNGVSLHPVIMRQLLRLMGGECEFDNTPPPSLTAILK